MIYIFTIPDKRILTDIYFKVQKTQDDYYEVMSINTGHCWIVRKVLYYHGMKVKLYHKHRFDEPYYHLHRSYCRNDKEAISIIQGHDSFVLKRSTNTINIE